ncbi:MAG: flagellar protein FhlB [Rhodospirillales bacterium]|nr:MAG: flagellar protein FhlB [Rhodospirillales bacterium]
MADSDPTGTSAPPVDRGKVAVALAYDSENDEAPRVVAGGRGAIAEQILSIAFANGIKVREDADLAEVLEAVEVGSTIPVQAFVAVAEVLAYVYRANGMLPAQADDADPTAADGPQPG